MATTKNHSSFQINQSTGVLFPLFSPEGEKLWVPGFDYENITGSTELHEDYIFLTKGPHQRDIWLVKRYEPSAYFVQYYMVEPVNLVSIVTVRCKPITEAKTEVEVSYEHIGLSEEGDEYVEGRSAEGFETYIGKWKMWLEGYFETKGE